MEVKVFSFDEGEPKPYTEFNRKCPQCGAKVMVMALPTIADKTKEAFVLNIAFECRHIAVLDLVKEVGKASWIWKS